MNRHPADALAVRLGPEAPQGLVVVLHGVGADAADMTPVATQLLGQLPGHAAAVLDAPEPFDGGDRGRQWFSIAGVTDVNRGARTEAALPPLWTRIEALLAHERLTASQLILLGFSQGAVMTLASAALGRPFAAGIALAGRLPVEPRPPGPGAPRLFISHGEGDPMVAFADGRQAARRLAAAGFQVRFGRVPHLGHGVIPAQLAHAVAFLRQSPMS
jgi:phospholipase/carboxylesterase